MPGDSRAALTQAFMEGKLEKKRRTRFGAPAGRKIVFFIDDVNMPAPVCLAQLLCLAMPRAHWVMHPPAHGRTACRR